MEKSIHTSEYALFLRLIRQARLDADLTQEGLADLLGTTQTFVSKCERGERRLDVIELHTWCSALGIDTARFVDTFAKCLQKGSTTPRRSVRNPKQSPPASKNRKRASTDSS